MTVREEDGRGIYGGAIGYLDFTGNLDTCISIRLAFKKNGKVFVRSGISVAKEPGAEIPILGVCLGHQAICKAYGATVPYARKLMHGKMSVVTIDTSCDIFRGMPEQIEAARYHSLTVLPETLPDYSFTRNPF